MILKAIRNWKIVQNNYEAKTLKSNFKKTKETVMFLLNAFWKTPQTDELSLFTSNNSPLISAWTQDF